MPDGFLHPAMCTITTLISSGDCTLQCGMWLWNRDSEITKWQHPAMWHVAVGWHANEFAQTSAILVFYIWFPFPHITEVHMSFCTSLRNFIQIGPPSAEKNDVMSIFKMAYLSHLGLLSQRPYGAPYRCKFTLKSRLWVTQGHWKWHRSTDWVRVPYLSSIVGLTMALSCTVCK